MVVVCAKSLQLRLTMWDPLDCSLPGSFLHGILQARILEWVAISSPRGSFQPRDRTGISCIAGGSFTTEPPGKPAGSQGIYINPWTFQFWLCSLTRVLCLSWHTPWRHYDIIVTSFRTGQQSWMHLTLRMLFICTDAKLLFMVPPKEKQTELFVVILLHVFPIFI